jgi:hypothetical protein
VKKILLKREYATRDKDKSMKRKLATHATKKEVSNKFFWFYLATSEEPEDILLLDK